MTGGATATADASGNYTFNAVANGTYTVTPSKAGYTFTPASQTVTVSGANVSAVNFTAQAVTLSGTVTPAASGTGATLTLAGPVNATTTADAARRVLVQRAAGRLVYGDAVQAAASPSARRAGRSRSAARA